MGGCCGKADPLAQYRKDKELMAATRIPDDTTYDGLVTGAKVVHVYDGDTVRVRFRHRGELVQHPVRLIGIDSPEMKPRLNDPNRDAIKRAAVLARDALIDQLPADSMIQLQCGKNDKYGRILGELFVGEICLNEWMVWQGHAVRYDGGTKSIVPVAV